VERGPDGRTNPMVNAGAIATASLAPGGGQDERWEFLRDGLSRFAGRPLSLDEEVYASAAATNHRNRALANLLQTYGRLGCDPAEAVDLYTRAELPAGERHRAGGDGRHPGQRRGQPADR
jgi:glutaminase